MPDQPFDPFDTPSVPSREDMFKFIQELESVRESLNVLSVNTQKAAEASRKMAEFYEKGGHSTTASRDQGRLFNSTGQALEGEAAFSSKSGGASESPAPPPPSQQGALRALHQGIRSAWEKRSVTAGMENYFNYNPMPGTEAAAGGGASRPPELTGSWEKHIKREVGEPLRMPQIGEFTAQNVLEYAAGNLQERAHNRLQREGHETGLSRLMGNSAGALARAAQFAPKVAMMHQFARGYGYDMRSHTQDGLGGLEGLGEKVGVSGGGGWGQGNITIPGTDIGFRIPFLNPAARKGFQEHFESWKDSLSPGANKNQSDYFREELYKRGWLGGPQTDRMRGGFLELMKFNKQLGSNPETYELADKAVRFGTTTMEEFTKKTKDMAIAMKSAHVSMDQMVADANALGEMNQAQGGSHWQGQKMASDLAGFSGIPGGVWAAAAENPWVQNYSTRTTGFAPWQQGLQSAGQRMSSMYGAVNEMYKLYESGAAVPRGETVKGVGGEEFNIKPTKRDIALANLHRDFPEISPEILERMTDPKERRRVEQGANIYKTLDVFEHRGSLTDAKDPNDGIMSWGEMRDVIDPKRGAIDPRTGKPLFDKKDIEAIEKAGGKATRGELKINGRMRAQFPQRAGESEDDYEDRLAAAHKQNPHLREEWGDLKWEGRKTEQQVGRDRARKMRKILQEKGDQTAKENQPKIVIELGANAKRKGWFLQNKDEAGAGGSSINVTFSNSPSYVPNTNELGYP